MAYLRKRGDRFYVEFYGRNESPRRKSIPIGRITRKAADRIRSRMEDEFALGEFDPWCTTSSITLGAAGASFLASKSQLSIEGQRNYRTHTRWVCDFLGADTALASIRSDDIVLYLDSRQLNDTSLHTYRRHLSVFWNFAKKQGWAKTNVAKEVSLPREPDPVARMLSDDDIDSICDAIRYQARTNRKITRGNPEWLIGVIRCNVYLGLRRTALCNLMWRDVEEEVVWARRMTKGNTVRPLPIVPPLEKELRALHRDTPFVFTTSSRAGKINPRYLTRAFMRYARMAGVDADFHSLRHTACGRLAKMGVPLEAIRGFAGHSSSQVTQRYMLLSSESHVSLIQKAFLGSGPLSS